ncbi:prephenate dehydrogenase/arogenate dehydrogenase family protein [bacterium]|nr:prephenate dehydrogenase/arogenate dehydrogenase family protein [bacterium]
MKKDNDIDKIRAEIDFIDLQIMQWLSKRGKCAQNIGKIKKGDGKNVYVPLREKQIFASLLHKNMGPYSHKAVQAIFQEIITQTRALEKLRDEKQEAYLYNQVSIIGVGIIGGSIGRDLIKKKIAKNVYGIDANPRTLLWAKKNRVITEIAKDEIQTLMNSDLVVFATPVCVIKEQLLDFAPFISDKALVIDVGSTKTAITKIADKCFTNGNFVGSHPMAGFEKSGVTASSDNLFYQEPCIIISGLKTKKTFIRQAKMFWKQLGANVLEMDFRIHDKYLAACSHLPHIISFALMASVGNKITPKEIKKIVGNSFKSYTRIAGSDPRMWTDIFSENKNEVLKQVTLLKKELEVLASRVQQSDGNKIYEYIEDAAKLWRKI